MKAVLAFFFNNLSQLVSVFCGFQEDPRIWYFPVGNIMQLIPLHSFTAVLKEPYSKFYARPFVYALKICDPALAAWPPRGHRAAGARVRTVLGGAIVLAEAGDSPASPSSSPPPQQTRAHSTRKPQPSPSNRTVSLSALPRFGAVDRCLNRGCMLPDRCS